MLTDNWSWYIIALAVLNILAMGWLLLVTGKKNNLADSDTTGHTWDGIEELNNPLPRWWLGLFIITIIFSGLYLALYPGLGNFKGTLGWTQMGQYEEALKQNRAKQDAFFAEFVDLDIPSLSVNAKAMETADRLFRNNCATCHGSDARGARGFPNLSDSDWLYGGEAATIQRTITNGRAGVMPNLGVASDDATILAYYLKGLAGEEVTDHVQQKGQVLFTVCAACHGLEGKGNQAIGAPNLSDNIWLHGSSIPEIETIILNGKQGNMPGFQTLLSANEIKLLSAYVYSLRTE